MHPREHPLHSDHLPTPIITYIVLQYRIKEIVGEWINHSDVEQVGLLAPVAKDTVIAPEIEDWEH